MTAGSGSPIGHLDESTSLLYVATNVCEQTSLTLISSIYLKASKNFIHHWLCLLFVYFASVWQGNARIDTFKLDASKPGLWAFYFERLSQVSTVACVSRRSQ